MVDETLLFLAAFVTVLFLYSLVSRRIERTVITAPMVFVAAGLLLGSGGIGLITLTAERSLVLLLAETALVLTLFSDASRINIHNLKRSGDLPARLLLLGLPLTIIAGVIAAVLLLTDLSLLEAAILACLLAPTDAALGEAIVTSEKVPLRIRQALNVEAGLNDGAVIPVLTLLWALAIEEEQYALGSGDLVVLALVQICVAVLVGGAVGYAGGWALSRAAEKEWMVHTYEWIALMGIAIAAWVLADILGGSGFIAAFVAGFATGAVYRQVVKSLITFTVAEGEVLGHLVFFILGVISYLFFEHFTLAVLLYAVLSLTVVRMVPVAISLVATRLSMGTVVFLGWFGPRGLASIVLMLTTLDEAGALPGMRTLAATVVATVMLSVFAHGISANPAIARYSRHAGTLHDAAPEKEAAAELPSRWGDRAKTGPDR